MIIKTFEINKKKFEKQNFFLIYGENEGLKNEIIQIIKENFKKNIENYDETYVLNNTELFYEKIFNRSFFDNEKIIIVNRSSEKIYEVVENIIVKNITDTKIIFNANVLEKKSKLRSLYEKKKN